MITSVADFLKNLKIKEEKLLKKYNNIKHGPMIGDMYEGLTKELLNKSIPEEFDLRIVSGKIKNSNDELSKQVDCMIVEGEGDKIPYSDNYIYNFSQVIAVIEVKKNLYSKDLKGAYENLRSIINIKEPKQINMRLLRDAYKSIARSELPIEEELDSLPFKKKMIYDLLVVENLLPVRIVFGYEGYSSEFNLREAFIKYLEENIGNKGFGPISFPNLIVCRNYSLIKLNGMPYADFEGENDFYHIYSSYSNNPILLLLELIWTRLSYKYGINSSVFFGNDLEQEVLHRFIECKPVKEDSISGWVYNYYSANNIDLEHLPDKKSWHPVILNDTQFTIINELCNRGEIDLGEDEFHKFIEEKEGNFKDFIKDLEKTGLIYIDPNEKLKLLTNELQTAIVPDLGFIAGENNSGRFTRWVEKYMDNRA